MEVFEKLKKENGSVTIEATISLSAFMFAIVTILTIVNVCLITGIHSMGVSADHLFRKNKEKNNKTHH